MLSAEIAAYERMQTELELDHFGKWVVVHDEKLFGAYEDFQEAADQAVRAFGRGPFLIRQVGAGPITLPPSLGLVRTAHADAFRVRHRRPSGLATSSTT